MALSVYIYYHTDYDNDSLSASRIEVSGGTLLTKDLLPELSNENYLFQGWYSTATFDSESKVTVGTIIDHKDLDLYAKWIPRNELNRKMIALANEIRELSGTDEAIGLDAMKTHVSEANEDVITEAELITQIVSALKGKTAGGSENEDAIVGDTMSGYYVNDRVTKIKRGTFMGCEQLISVSFPVCTTIGRAAFEDCHRLTSINIPVCEIIGSAAFSYCVALTSVNFPVCKTINNAAFNNCNQLKTISFPACESIGTNAFLYCDDLTFVSFPACKTISNSAFYSCSTLTSANFPACTSIDNWAFGNCRVLTSANFPACTSIDDWAFHGCYNLKSLYLTGSSLCTLSNSNAFGYTPIGGYSTSAETYGSIYVPASLLTSYQTATNWTYFSSRFIGI
jgi:uncharacterized repeat protein (TIGR02543 family)